jgi:hypothetical protein
MHTVCAGQIDSHGQSFTSEDTGSGSGSPCTDRTLVRETYSCGPQSRYPRASRRFSRTGPVFPPSKPAVPPVILEVFPEAPAPHSEHERWSPGARSLISAIFGQISRGGTSRREGTCTRASGMWVLARENPDALGVTDSLAGGNPAAIQSVCSRGAVGTRRVGPRIRSELDLDRGGRALRGSVEHRFHVVPVRIQEESRVVARVVRP